MKTAVEWLIEQLENHNGVTRAGFQKCIEQAIAMEKKEIKRAYTHGQKSAQFKYPLNAEEYHNETFKSE